MLLAIKNKNQTRLLTEVIELSLKTSILILPSKSCVTHSTREYIIEQQGQILYSAILSLLRLFAICAIIYIYRICFV